MKKLFDFSAPGKSLMFRMTLRKIGMVLIFMVVGFFVLHKQHEQEAKKEAGSAAVMFSTMSTICSVQFFGEEQAKVKDATLAVQKSIVNVNDICNIFDPESELSKLNASAADAPFHCSETLWHVIAKAKAFYTMTDGAFDVTCGPLIALWTEAGKRGSVPTEAELATAKELSGFDLVELNSQEKTVSFKKKGVSINLGGIAKGYALDIGCATAEKCGVSCGWINLGGNVRTLKTAPRNREMCVAAVQDPFDRKKVLAKIHLLDSAISTSGNYERFSMIDGHRYGHILDPRTGMPVEGVDSVTVVAELGLDSDALSTAIFVGGPELVKKLESFYPGLRILMVRGGQSNPEIVRQGDDWEL